MSTAAAELVIDRPNLATPIIQDVDPLTIRWGVQVSQRDKPVNSYECGFSAIPFGKFFPIATIRVKRENHTIDWTQPKERETLLTASERETFLMEALGGGGAQNPTNWGLRTGFKGEDDPSKMAVISETLLPTLTRIREIQAQVGASVISEVCEGSDDLDFGVRDSCVRCWWQWIKSPVVDAYIETIALQGRTVFERDPATGETTERLVRPSVNEFRSAKTTLIESMQQGIKQLEQIWKQIAEEYTKNDQIRKDISEFEHGYRKDLHQNRPEDRQFALAREIAKSTNTANSGSNDELMRMMVQSQLETNQLLRESLAKQAPIAVESIEEVVPCVNLAETSEVPTTSPALKAMEAAKKTKEK